MALSPAARSALEKFKSQQTGSEREVEADDEFAHLPSLGERIASERPDNGAQTAALLAGVLPTENDSQLFRPEQPKTFEESGISYRVLEGLILKAIKQEGPRNEAQLAEFLHVGM